MKISTKHRRLEQGVPALLLSQGCRTDALSRDRWRNASYVDKGESHGERPRVDEARRTERNAQIGLWVLTAKGGLNVVSRQTQPCWTAQQRDAGEAEPLLCVRKAKKIEGRSGQKRKPYSEMETLLQHGSRTEIQNVLQVSQQMLKRTKDTDDAVSLLMPYDFLSLPNIICLLRKTVDPESIEVHFQYCRRSEDVKRN